MAEVPRMQEQFAARLAHGAGLLSWWLA